MAAQTTATKPPYPVTLAIDYLDRPLNRLTTFFRIFTVIPIAIILALVSGSDFGWSGPGSWSWLYATGGILFLPPLLMILFR
jgi:hypothetical protein